MANFLQNSRAPGRQLAVGGAEWGPLVAGSFLPADFDMGRGEFHGSLKSDGIADLLLVSMQCEMHSAHRSEAHVRSAAAPELVVTFQKSGTLRIDQDGRSGTVHPGQFAVFSTARPVTITGSNHYRSLSLKFPLVRCRDAAPVVHEITGIPFDGQQGLGPAVAGMLEGLDRAAAPRRAPSASRVAQKVVGMVEELLLDELAHGRVPAGRDPSQTLLEQCFGYIAEHLHDPELSPQQVAEANFMSTRYLHVLFQRTSTTVAAYIREQRIARVCEDLADVRHHRTSIDGIARRWGFVNASHFGKVFKKATGETPMEFRLRCRQHALN